MNLFLACPVYGMEFINCEPYPTIYLPRQPKLKIAEEPLDPNPPHIECVFYRVPDTSRYETCSRHHEEL